MNRFLLILALVTLITGAEAQSVSVGVSPHIPIIYDNATYVDLNVSVGFHVTSNYSIGVDIDYTPARTAMGDVMFYNSVGAQGYGWELSAKAGFGLGHTFTNEATDHNYIVYGAGVRIERIKPIGVFIEPSLNFRTYTAYISPSAEHGWFRIKVGFVLNIK